MRIRTVVGLAVAGTAAAGVIAGGVAYAAAEGNEPGGEPIVRIVEQEAPAGDAAQQPAEDCPEREGTQPSQTGL